MASPMFANRIRSLSLLLTLLGAIAATERAPAQGEPEAQPLEISRERRVTPGEMPGLLGLDESFFQEFKDGQPLTDASREKLLPLLAGLGRVSPAVLAESARAALAVDRLTADPAAARGEIFQLRFDVTRITRVELSPEHAEQFGFAAYYRCRANLGVYPLEFVARHVPGSWKPDRTLDEPCTALGMFLQELPAPNAELEPRSDGDHAAEHVPLLFAADRIAWHPSTLLAYLGVDYGLLEDVEDRTSLKESVVFYQMLAASSRMTGEYLKYQIRRLLKDDLEYQQRLARNRDLSPVVRANAERAVARLESGVSDVAPLFNDPDKNRGRFVLLEGEALRAVEIRIDDPQIQRRFNLDHYFEVEIVIPDSYKQPIVCCLAELPPGMPLGESIHESVRVAGFFLKSWPLPSYRSNSQAVTGEKPTSRFSPLLVGKTLEVIAPLRFTLPTQSLQLLAGLAIVLGISGIAIWRATK